MLSGPDGHNQQTQNNAGATNERFSEHRADQQVHNFSGHLPREHGEHRAATHPHLGSGLASTRTSHSPALAASSWRPTQVHYDTAQTVPWHVQQQRPHFQQSPQPAWRRLPAPGQPLHAGRGQVGYVHGAGGGQSGGRGRGRWRGPVGSSSSVALPAWSVVSGEEVVHTAIAAIASLAPTEAVESNPVVVECLMRMDSRQASSFFKQLGVNERLGSRAWELFAWLRSLTVASTHAALRGLLDVYVYTAMISLCAQSRNVSLALELSAEMDNRNIPHNVHTFSALMNVLVKSGQSQHALEVFNQMQTVSCKPNLVTFNTLIDCYGKLGLWNEALVVVQTMRSQGIEPVARTYNTLMIACTTSNAWQEALNVYHQMLAAGIRPNTTTFNAVISAYSKAGSMEMVMDTFQRMLDMGCERSVITYSTLISAAEKMGYWNLALQFFERMRAEQIHPNTITFNSLVTACAQGMQFETAMRLFEQMPFFGCQPDVVSFTAVITACARVCQWQRALTEFRRMQTMRCKEDHIVYEAILDALWNTGVLPAQRHAAQLHREGSAKGLIKHPTIPELHSKAEAGLVSVEVTLGMLNSGLVLMCLGAWLADIREYMRDHGVERLPQRITVRVTRPRAREVIMSPGLRRVINQWAEGHGCPLDLLPDASGTGTIRLAFDMQLLSSWLLSDMWNMVQYAAAFVSPDKGPPTLPEEEHSYQPKQRWSVQCFHNLVPAWEATHSAPPPNSMPADYLQHRTDTLEQLFQVGTKLRIPCEVLHDAAQLLDRVVCTRATPVSSLKATAFAVLLLVAEQPSPLPMPPLSPAAQARQQLQHTISPLPLPEQHHDPAQRMAGGRRTGNQAVASSGGLGLARPTDRQQAWVLPRSRLARLAGVTESELVARAQAISSLLKRDTISMSAVHSLRLFHVCLAYGDGLIPPPHIMFARPVLSRRQAQSLRMVRDPQQGSSSQDQLTDAMGGLMLASGSNQGSASSPDAPSPSQSRAGTSAPKVSTGTHAAGTSVASGDMTCLPVPPSSTDTPALEGEVVGPPSGSHDTVGRSATQQPSRVQVTPGARVSSGGDAGPSDAAAAEPEPERLPVAAVRRGVPGQTVVPPPMDHMSMELMSYRLLHEVVRSGSSLGFRPSTLAAAALYASRVMYGILPNVPTTLSQLLGIKDLSDMEMFDAINIMTRIDVQEPG